MTMTFEEWKEKRENEKKIKEYLEKSRQNSFAEEQRKESALTRESRSIVDADSV